MQRLRAPIGGPWVLLNRITRPEATRESVDELTVKDKYMNVDELRVLAYTLTRSSDRSDADGQINCPPMRGEDQ